jgi:hypothetical protein
MLRKDLSDNIGGNSTPKASNTTEENMRGGQTHIDGSSTTGSEPGWMAQTYFKNTSPEERSSSGESRNAHFESGSDAEKMNRQLG